MSNISEVINKIPEMLQYFISGFIFLKVFCFLATKNNLNTSFFTILSVVISFVITSTVRLLDAVILPQLEFIIWAEVVVCALTSVCLAFVMYCVYLSKAIRTFLSKFAHKSFNDDIWRDIVDYDKGTTFKVFLKGNEIIYIGKLIAHEEKGLDSWFALKDYTCMYMDEGTTTYEFDSTEIDMPSIAVINFRDIERAELFYKVDTQIFD